MGWETFTLELVSYRNKRRDGIGLAINKPEHKHGLRFLASVHISMCQLGKHSFFCPVKNLVADPRVARGSIGYEPIVELFY